MNSYVRAWKKPLGKNSKRLNMYYIYIALDCLNWERPPFRLARKLAWFWPRLARYLIFLAKYPFFLLRISWLIGASGSGFIFLEPPIRLGDSQFANRVLGQSSNLSGYKKSPKSLIYKGFRHCALASLARFERAAFRLGVTFLPFFHCFSKFFSGRFCSKKPLKSRALSRIKVWKSLSLSDSVFHKLLASVSRNGESHEIFDLNHKRVDGTNSAWYDSQILVRIQFETINIAIFLPFSLVWSLEMITTFGLIYMNIIL